jgi:hypothetical protein
MTLLRVHTLERYSEGEAVRLRTRWLCPAAGATAAQLSLSQERLPAGGRNVRMAYSNG